MKIHESITIDRILPIVEDNMFGMGNTGICNQCGEEQGGCEPDARDYLCEGCGAFAVCGAEEYLLELCP